MSTSTLVRAYAGTKPAFATPPVHGGPNSVVLGRATLGRNAWLGSFSVIRADGHFVKIGDDFHLGMRSTVHINHDIFPCIIGDRVSVGRNACVHACTVGNDVAIGDAVVILDGAVVEDNVVLEPGATVFPNKRVPGGFVYAGSPAKPARALQVGEVAKHRAHLHGHNGNEPAEKTALGQAARAEVHPSVFIAPTATVRGRVVAAESASVWFSNHLDAGQSSITIGARTNIQDNTIVRCSTSQGVSIGGDSIVGHNVMLHDCIVGDHSLIGIGSTVAEGTVVADRVLLAAAARTTPGQVLESGWLYAGNPARKLAPLDDAKLAVNALIVEQYCQYARDFAALQRERG